MKKKAKKDKKEKKIYTTPEDSVEMTPENIATIAQLQSFIKKLPKCHTISSRLTATKNLLDIKNNELYQKCIELKGLSYLSSWLKEYKKSVASGTDLTRDEEFIVINIIFLCERIHLSINDLKTSKIGKNINSLGKALPEGSNVRKSCEEIVSKWREMIDSNNEGRDDENVEQNNGNNNEEVIYSSLNPKNNYLGGNMAGGAFNNNNIQFLKLKRNNQNFKPCNNSINTNTNNINLNTNCNNTSNKINSIKIKAYVKNSTNLFFYLLSKIKKSVIFLKITLNKLFLTLNNIQRNNIFLYIT